MRADAKIAICVVVGLVTFFAVLAIRQGKSNAEGYYSAFTNGMKRIHHQLAAAERNGKSITMAELKMLLTADGNTPTALPSFVKQRDIFIALDEVELGSSNLLVIVEFQGADYGLTGAGTVAIVDPDLKKRGFLPLAP